MAEGIVIGNLTIPVIKGDKGDTGEAGKIISISLVMLSPSSTAYAVNNGSTTQAQIELGIPKGLSVSTININASGELVFTFNDGTSSNVGKVVGKGISEVTVTDDFDFVVTYTDGTSVTACNLEDEILGAINDILESYYTKTEIDEMGFITKEVNNLTNYTLKTNTGSSIELSINNSTYVMTLKLKNSAGTTISTGTIDLPLETMVVGATYDNTNKKIVLTLKNGSTIDVPVADLVSGLQAEITNANKLSADLVDDTSTTHKFTSTSEKNSWNAKYTKPSGGIPKTDLESSVQTSLGKADTAVQDVSGKEDKTNKTSIIDENSTNTQYTGAKAVYDYVESVKTEIETEQTEQDEHIEVLEKVVSNLPKTEEKTGSNITLENTIEGYFYHDDNEKGMKLNGQTEQDTTDGNQLINFNSYSYKTNSTDYSFTNDIVTISSSAVSYASVNWRVTSLIKNNPGKKLYFSYEDIDVSNQLNVIAQINIEYNDGTANSYIPLLYHHLSHPSYTIPNDTSNISYVNFGIYSNNSTNNTDDYSVTIVKPQLQFGETELPYEPYTGEIASPNPNYEQKIKCVTGNQDVVVSGKNEFDIGTSLDDYFQTGSNGTKIGNMTVNAATATIENNKLTIDSYNTNGYNWISKWVNLKKDTDYIISGTNDSGLKIVGFTSNELQAIGTQIIDKSASDTTKSFNSGNYEYYCLSFYPGSVGKYFENIQIEQGNQATTYEPYITPTSYQLSLGDRKVFEGDYFLRDNNGKFYHHHKMGRKIIDGTNVAINDRWSTNTTDYYRFIIPFSNNQNTTDNDQTIGIYCNKLKEKTSNQTYQNNVGINALTSGNRIAIYTDETKSMSIVNANAWLSNNNLEVVYPLETETDEEITGALAEQLEALYNAHSNNGTTIIETECESSNLPIIVKASALETQKVDLTNYYTKTQTDTLLNAKVDKSSFVYDSTTETLSITMS